MAVPSHYLTTRNDEASLGRLGFLNPRHSRVFKEKAAKDCHSLGTSEQERQFLALGINFRHIQEIMIPPPPFADQFNRHGAGSKRRWCWCDDKERKKCEKRKRGKEAKSRQDDIDDPGTGR